MSGIIPDFEGAKQAAEDKLRELIDSGELTPEQVAERTAWPHLCERSWILWRRAMLVWCSRR